MKKIKEEMLDLYIKHACEEYLDQMVEEYPTLESLKGKYEFSPGFEKWAKDIIKKETKRNKKPSRAWMKTKKVSLRMSIAICLIVACLALVAFTVPPVRNTFLNYFVDKQENIELYSFDNTNKKGQKKIDNMQEYYIEGFNIVEVTELNSLLYITYSNNDNKYFYLQRDIANTNAIIDGEDKIFEKIIINDKEANISYDEKMTTIIYSDNKYLYRLFSDDISKKELIKLAKNYIK